MKQCLKCISLLLVFMLFCSAAYAVVPYQRMWLTAEQIDVFRELDWQGFIMYTAFHKPWSLDSSYGDTRFLFRNGPDSSLIDISDPQKVFSWHIIANESGYYPLGTYEPIPLKEGELMIFSLGPCEPELSLFAPPLDYYIDFGPYFDGSGYRDDKSRIAMNICAPYACLDLEIVGEPDMDAEAAIEEAVNLIHEMSQNPAREKYQTLWLTAEQCDMLCDLDWQGFIMSTAFQEPWHLQGTFGNARFSFRRASEVAPVHVMDPENELSWQAIANESSYLLTTNDPIPLSEGKLWVTAINLPETEFSLFAQQLDYYLEFGPCLDETGLRDDLSCIYLDLWTPYAVLRIRIEGEPDMDAEAAIDETLHLIYEMSQSAEVDEQTPDTLANIPLYEKTE